MEKDVKNLLIQVLANQVVLYKKIEKMQDKMDSRLRSAPMQSYAEELKKEADEAISVVQRLFA